MRIRKGTQADIPELLERIKELAAYEKAAGQVEVTEQELLHDGFGLHPRYYFLVAEINGRVEGIALYYFKYSTWKGNVLFLEDIIVRETSRRNGLGSKLFEEVVKIASAEKCRRMDWQVLEWNQPAIDFYKKYNAFLDAEWLDGRLFERDIQRIATQKLPV